MEKRGHLEYQQCVTECSGQLIPDSKLGRFSAFAAEIPLLLREKF